MVVPATSTVAPARPSTRSLNVIVEDEPSQGPVAAKIATPPAALTADAASQRESTKLFREFVSARLKIYAQNRNVEPTGEQVGRRDGNYKYK